MILSGISKLLIVRLSSLGDILLTTPVIRSIKKIIPAIQIDFVLRQKYSDVLKLNDNINKIHYYPDSKVELSTLKKRLSSNKYEMVLDLQNNFRSQQLLSGITSKQVKFEKKSIDKFLLVHFKINRLKNAGSISQRYALTIPGLRLDSLLLDLKTNKKNSEELLGGYKFIGLCPGARHFTKMWSEDYFVRLGKLLIQSGFKVVLMGGKSDVDLCKRLNGAIPGSINLCRDDELLQIAADLKKCDAVYCNDSGLMHVASAVNTPVISFFGSTVEEFGFAPAGSKNIILQNKILSCRPCSHIGRKSCPKKHFNCMLQISPEYAFAQLKDLKDNL